MQKKSSKSNQTSILIIYTGGTVGMIKNNKGQLIPFNFQLIEQQIPELHLFNYKLEVVSFKKTIDSSNMNPTHWIELVEIIEKNYAKYDGFVILHGTDTMAYTASALSFMIQNLTKPIIITGSQLPIGEVRTDAKENIITSLEIAAAKHNNFPIVPEVCIYFNYHLFRGNRSKKVESTHFDAFYSENYPPLAEAGIEIEFRNELLLAFPKKKTKFMKEVCKEVAIIKLFPGINFELIAHILKQKNLKGVVIETFGAGNAPTDKKFISILEKAIKAGIIILNVSQCVGGSVVQGLYQTSSELNRIGVISAKDITSEAAITKLMIALGFKTQAEQIDFLKKNICGEMSD
jgi:L-asparaginase